MASKVTLYTILDDGEYSTGPVKRLKITGGKCQATEDEAQFLLRASSHAFSRKADRFKHVRAQEDIQFAPAVVGSDMPAQPEQTEAAERSSPASAADKPKEN